MLSVVGHDIIVSRGDTGAVTITFTGDVPADGTVALITVRKSPDMIETPVWEKRVDVENGSVTFPLTTSDTDIQWFDYCWDVRLLYEDTSVYTPFAPALFRVTEVVGDV